MTGNQYVYVDLTSASVYQNPGRSVFNFGPWVAGQTVTYTLRFLQKQVDGSVFGVNTDTSKIRALRVGVGDIDRRPESGSFSLIVNGFSRKFDWNVSAWEIQDRLNDLLPFNVFCDDLNGTIEIRAEDGRILELQVDANELMPPSGARIHSSRAGGVFSYHIRLVQLPVAFTDFYDDVLPAPPFVKEIQKGQTSSDGVTKYPEIQSLFVPPDFESVYQLAMPGSLKRTKLLTKNDGVSAIEAALKAAVGSVTVTNPLNNIAYIEFNKENNGIDFPNLDVIVPNPLPPDLRFSLDLNTKELYSLLRDRDSVKIPFEAEMLVDINPSDPSEGTALIKLWKTEVVISKPLIWEGMASVAPIGWQERAYPKDYIPFTKQQSIIGQQQSYVVGIGDGVSREFILDHNLGGAFISESIVSSTPNGSSGTIFRVIGHGLSVGETITVSGHSVYELNGVHGVSGIVDANQFIVNTISSKAGVGGYVAMQDIFEDSKGIDYYSQVGVQNVVLRENKPGGKVIRDGYDVYFLSASSLKIVFAGVPRDKEYIAIVIGYGPKSAFLSHTHPIDAIQYGGERLRDILEEMKENIDRLFRLIPRNIVQVASGLPPVAVKIPTFGEILPDLALVETDTGNAPTSIASQLVAETVKNKPPEVIAGTDLDKKRQELEAELTAMKLKAEAEIKAAREAAAAAAKEAEEKARQEAAAKQVVTNISRVRIAGFGIRPKDASSLWGHSYFPEKRGAKFPWLLPALHSAAPITSTQVPSLSEAKGRVYINGSSGALFLPGGGGRKAQAVPPGGFFGGDGRAIYALSKGLNENTFYPLEMERVLVKAIISKNQFPVNSALTMRWDTSTDLRGAVDGGCSCVMAVELRPITAAATPAPTGENTGAIGEGVVIAAPRITFSLNSVEARSHYLKLERRLSAEGVYSSSSNFTTYGTDAGGIGFGGGDFILSVALVKWDVDDSTASPLGSVGFYMKDTEISVDLIS